MNTTSWRNQVGAPKRGGWLRWGLAAVVVVGAIVLLREATMNRPDPPRAEATSVIELVVRRNETNLSAAQAANALWATCSVTVDQHRLAGLEPIEGNRFAVTLAPALGHHAEQRLVGCLEDLAVPRILGEVARVDHR